MIEIRDGARTQLEAEIAIGAILGVPPTSIRLSAVVALDGTGKLWVAGAPGFRTPEGRKELAWLLGEARAVLSGDGVS